MFKFKRLLIAISAALAVIFIFCFNQVGVQADVPAPHLSASAAADLESFCESLWVHEGAQHKNLVIFPVTLRAVRDSSHYTTLDEALESGKVKITEVGSGSVPTLHMEILSTEPLFFMAGEVVTGAKQDRILTHDLLFHGFKGGVDLPVYCVEQGRWNSVGDRFKAGKILGSTALRQTAVMKEGQHTAWAEVQQKNADMDASTATGTFQATYDNEKYRKAESEFMDKLRDIPSKHDGQVCGVVIAIDGKVVSADLFANPSLFRKLWPKVLKAAITDSVTAGGSATSDNTAARELLGAVLKAKIAAQDNPSQGQEFTLSSDKVQGSFIRSSEGVAHLALFTGAIKRAAPSEDEEPQLQIQRQNQDNHLRDRFSRPNAQINREPS